MATVVNDRDVLIMGTSPRYTPPTDRGMFLTPSTAVFKLSADGLTASPSSFQFVATLLNMTGTVTWSTTGGISLVTNGNTATLNFASFTAVSGTIAASITVDGQQYTQTATVTKLADGTIGHDGVRGTINISAATGGVIWSDSDANAAIAAAGYGSHQIRDVVTLYNQAGKFSKTRFWDGSAWQDVAQVLDGNLLVQGSVNAQSLAVNSITASKLVIGAADNILPDPQFRDLAWWGLAGLASVSQWADQGIATGWVGGASMYLGTAVSGPTNGSGGNWRDTDSQYFNMEPGATYRLTFQVNIPSGFSGGLSVYWLMPGSAWWAMCGDPAHGGPDVGAWQDGLRMQFDNRHAGSLWNYQHTITVPANNLNARGMIRIRAQYSGANLEIGAMSIVRVSDGTLIKDGAITSQKISVQQLDAVAARIGTLRTATSGARTEIADNVIKMFADNNQKILHLGDSTK